MNVTERSAIERGTVGLCSIVLWLSMTVIFFILVSNTILRYSTGSSLQWANELPELLFPWLVTAGVVMAAVHGAHIATVFLIEAVPQRVQRAIGVLGWLVVAALYGTLSLATFRMLDIVHDEKSPILQVPGSVTYGCVMGGMALLALLALQSAWRVWRAQPKSDSNSEPQVPSAHW